MANGFQMTRQLFLICALFLASISSQLGAEEKARRIGIIMEGSFESPDVSKELKGAKSTQMVASYEWDYGIRPFSNELWAERGLSWEILERQTEQIADKLLEEVTPKIVRDDRGVVEYIILRSEDPFLTSVILSDKLIPAFEEMLGDRIHAVLPDRHRVYLFPATGGTLKEYGPSLVNEFLDAELPVSLEVFLIEKAGVEAIGELERE